MSNPKNLMVERNYGGGGNRTRARFLPKRTTREYLKGLVCGFILAGLLIAVSGKAAYKHRFPHWWYRQAVCVHRHESTNWRAATGNGFFGGFQFMLGTWRRVGGRGYPFLASPNEQYFRTWLIWRQDGGSWREWPNTSRMCGLV